MINSSIFSLNSLSVLQLLCTVCFNISLSLLLKYFSFYLIQRSPSCHLSLFFFLVFCTQWSWRADDFFPCVSDCYLKTNKYVKNVLKKTTTSTKNLLMALEQIFPVLMDRWAVGQLCVSLESNCRMNY